MRFRSFAELPALHSCRKCGQPKPIAEMVVVRLRREGIILLRARCKSCHNEKEKGHRRAWKRQYLRNWRSRSRALNESYWRQRNAAKREELNAYAYRHFLANHDAILIQGRLRRRLGTKVSLAEARKLLLKFGPCYPTSFGLTPPGLRECERIRSRLRAAGAKPNNAEIRLMVYADAKKYFIKPRFQKRPYQSAAEKLREWHRNRKAA